MKTTKSIFLLNALLLVTITAKAQDMKILTPDPRDSGYVAVDGGKLYYEMAGKGPAIVLLHDGMVPCTIWDEQFHRKYESLP